MSFSYKQQSHVFSGKKRKSRRKEETSNGSGTDICLNFTQTQPNCRLLSPQFLILLCSYPKVQPKACLPKEMGFSSGISWCLSQHCFKSMPTSWHEGKQKQWEGAGAPSPACGRASAVPAAAPRRAEGLVTPLTHTYCNCNSTSLVFSKQKNQVDY